MPIALLAFELVKREHATRQLTLVLFLRQLVVVKLRGLCVEPPSFRVSDVQLQRLSRD